MLARRAKVTAAPRQAQERARFPQLTEAPAEDSRTLIETQMARRLAHHRLWDVLHDANGGPKRSLHHQAASFYSCLEGSAQLHRPIIPFSYLLLHLVGLTDPS